jgi:hypothetical protein
MKYRIANVAAQFWIRSWQVEVVPARLRRCSTRAPVLCASFGSGTGGQESRGTCSKRGSQILVAEH